MRSGRLYDGCVKRSDGDETTHRVLGFSDMRRLNLRLLIILILGVAAAGGVGRRAVEVLPAVTVVLEDQSRRWFVAHNLCE